MLLQLLNGEMSCKETMPNTLTCLFAHAGKHSLCIVCSDVYNKMGKNFFK